MMRQRFFIHILMYAPFITCAFLVTIVVAARYSDLLIDGGKLAKLGLYSNAISMLIGFASLVFATSKSVWYRILLALLYFPSLLFSMLISGY